MKRRCGLVLLAVALVGADKKSDAVDKEMKSLQGKWKVMSIVAAGNDQKLGKDDEGFIVINENSLAFTDKNGKEEMKATFKINPTTKLKSMDWATKRGDMPIDIPLIYSLEGDDLKIVMPLVEKGKGETPKRPDTFDTKDKPLMLFTLKRVKK
jgi:uncharacterized protein (TIGR03067 family)